MSRHTITWLRSGTYNGTDWEAEYEVEFEYRAGRPAKMYLRNGDPGYPADPDEIEVVNIKPEIGSLDAREKAEAIDAAQLWIDSDGYDDAIEQAASDAEDARESAALSKAGV